MATWMIRGSVHELGYRMGPRYPELQLTIGDLYLDGRIPPVSVKAYGAMATYLHDLYWTDDEERYITADWYYSDIDFQLLRVERHSKDPMIPAKVIAQDFCQFEDLKVFGPKDHLDDPDPEPMSKEEMQRLYEYRTAWESDRMRSSSDHWYGGNRWMYKPEPVVAKKGTVHVELTISELNDLCMLTGVKAEEYRKHEKAMLEDSDRVAEMLDLTVAYADEYQALHDKLFKAYDKTFKAY